MFIKNFNYILNCYFYNKYFYISIIWLKSKGQIQQIIMKSKKVFFSIVVPCYNVQDTLKETIESILKQDFNDYEIVAVDDGSFDNTSQILINYKIKNNIKVITQSNKGLGAARNTGIKASDGIYICLLDADDLWVPNKLTKVYEIIKNKKHALISNDEIILGN